MHAIQAAKIDGSGKPISYYMEHLDLFGFGGRQYDDNLLNHLTDKYGHTPIGVILSIGPGALDFAIKLRATAWPAVPIVFTAVSEETAPHPLPPKTTGFFVQKSFANMVKAARGILPDLRRLVLVGNPFEGAVYYPQFADEIPKFSDEFEIIDLMGLPVREIQRHVAALPPDSAVFYFGINADAERRYASAVEPLILIAEATSRPIIGDAETEIGAGAIGGFVLRPDEVGRDASRLVMRIFDGEDASDIPALVGNTLTPMFDWRQLQRWNISESALPAGSEIRFRPPDLWDRYRAQLLLVVAAILTQFALIFWLTLERRRRAIAEAQSRNSISELAYMNRRATAGELSASIAHEISQPLTGIVARGSAALRWLHAETPNLQKVGDALEQIINAGHRAGEILASLRALFKKDTSERAPLDINKLIRSVLELVEMDLWKHSVQSHTNLAEHLPLVIGNEVQLQQVVLNLVMNAIEAMSSADIRVLSVKSEVGERDTVHVSIEDTGSGIDPSDVDSIFKPLFTTKARGMGMGLSICRSIIESHDGRIWVSAGSSKGSIFQFELPCSAPSAKRIAPEATNARGKPEDAIPA
jgi:signal transduction histidine kinase